MPAPALCLLKNRRAQRLAETAARLFEDDYTGIVLDDGIRAAYDAAKDRFVKDAVKLTGSLEKVIGHVFAGVSIETETHLTITLGNTTSAARQTLQLLKTFDDLMLLLDEARIRGAVSMRDYDKLVKRAEWHLHNWLRLMGVDDRQTALETAS